MSFLKKLLGRRVTTESPLMNISSESQTLPKNPTEDQDMIRVFDAYGREYFITRQQWRDNVLLGTIEKNWDDSEKLSGFIIQSLNDNFFKEMVKPAERLLQLEPDSERSAVLLAIVYLKVKRLDDSEKILQQYVSKHGESGIVLTNIAKIYAERGEEDKTLETLWRALQLDPNQDNGLGWYEVIHREKGGVATGLEALRRIAVIPGSWRAQMWLARSELGANNLSTAFTLYQESLANVGKPVPIDLLMQMSGDLGNSGYLHEILQLVEPHFEPSVHGLQVGNNLIKAHFDLGQFDHARRILDQLFALKRPDWKPNLGYWDTELAKARIGDGKVEDNMPLNVTILVGQGPVWLKPESSAKELFPVKAADILTISFLGCSAEMANSPQHIEMQLADAPGRISRALPLFLAEQMEFRCGVRTQTLVPWILEPIGGFVLSGHAWENEDAVRYANQCNTKSDYIVVSHLITNREPWAAQIRLLRVADGKLVGQLSESFLIAEPSQAFKQLSQHLAELVSSIAGITQQAVPISYTVPEGSYFPLYLLRLEQLLAVRCDAMESAKPGFLNGEREIIDGNLQQCLDAPTSINCRLLLGQTLLAMKSARPDILPEFAERIALLQKEKPLAEPAQSVVQRLFEEAFVA